MSINLSGGVFIFLCLDKKLSLFMPIEVSTEIRACDQEEFHAFGPADHGRGVRCA